MRAQEGEAREPSRGSLQDMSPSRRGGLRSHKGAGGRTFRQLYDEARAHGVVGRSSMNKGELERSLKR